MKLTNLFFIMLTVLLFSCGGDDDDPAVGTWQLSSIVTTGCSDPTENVSLQLDDDGCITEQDITICLLQTLEFNDNGTLDFDFSIDIPGSEELGIDADDLGLEFDGIVGSDDGAGTWTSISDNVIEICSDGECNQIDISINGDNMTLTNSDAEDDDCMSRLVYKKN